MEMILFIGIQATGKSEFYKRRFYKTHIRINLDMLRTRNREGILVDACIKAKQPFVIDNTNPTRADREKYIVKTADAGFKIIGYYFQSEIKAALARNEERRGKECLPKAAILSTHRKLELPALEEGFDELYYTCIDPEGDFIVEGYQDEV